MVATVPSLEGEEIEPYANELFRAWKLGETKKNNGVLLLIAPKERRVRIEVGYGLEGTLTDAVSSIIIANAIAPRFKAGDFNGGVTRGVDDIITALTTDSAEWKPKKTDMRAEHDATLFDAIAPFLIFLFIMFVIQPDQPKGRRQRRHPDGRGRLRPWRRLRGRGLWRGRVRRRRLFRRRRVVGRRRRVGGLVMIDPAEAARIEAAFDAAQTRDPRAARLRAGAGLGLARRRVPAGACILALATPLPLLLFTELSAHRIYVAQLLVAILAAVLGAAPWLRRILVPNRWARSACHRAALAQFVLRGIDRSQCGVLVYVSLAEHYIRIVAAEEAAAVVSHEQWQALVDEALGPLANGAIETALTELADGCADRLAGPFPPTTPWEPPSRQRFHVL